MTPISWKHSRSFLRCAILILSVMGLVSCGGGGSSESTEGYTPAVTDTDGDGVGNNTDAFPEDSTETVDLDGDGVGDNADLNDDGDAWTDLEEIACDTDPMDASSVPADYDGNMVCDKLDPDDDGDGVNDRTEAAAGRGWRVAWRVWSFFSITACPLVRRGGAARGRRRAG